MTRELFFGSWGDDILVEADEVDLDAVDAHPTTRRAVKVLARVGGTSSSEARFLRRVLRYDAATESFCWCSGKRFMLDATAAPQLTGRSRKCKTAGTLGTEGTGATLRDGDQKLDGNETAAFRIALATVMHVALDRLHATKTVASFTQCPTKSGMVKLMRLVRYLLGFLQAEKVCSRQGEPKYLDVYGDSDWAGDDERERSTTGVTDLWRSSV